MTEIKPGETMSVVVGAGGSGVSGGAGGGYTPFRQAPSNLSFIEPHEEDEARQLLDAQLRLLTKDFDKQRYPDGVTFSDHAKLTRYFCAVKIYVRPEDLKEIKTEDGSIAKLILPDSIRAEDRYQACVGLVLAMGPDAFLDKDRRPKGSIYKPGDWVVFSRSDIIRIDFCDVALGIMTDDRAIIVTDDPTMWSMGRAVFKA